MRFIKKNLNLQAFLSEIHFQTRLNWYPFGTYQQYFFEDGKEIIFFRDLAISAMAF